MIPYVFLLIYILLLIVIFARNNISKRQFLYLAFIPIIFFLAFRAENVGEDTTAYIKIARNIKSIPVRQLLSEFPRTTISRRGLLSTTIETVYALYCKLLLFIFKSEYVVIPITSVITGILMARFIYLNTEHIYQATLMYLCESSFMLTFNATRQFFAISIALQALPLCRNKRYAKAVCIILISALFEISAVCYLIIIPFYMIKDKRRLLRYVVIASLFIETALPVLSGFVAKFSGYYSEYFILHYWDISVRGALLFIIFVFATLIYLLICKNEKQPEDYLFMCCVVIFLALEILGWRYTMLQRVAWYFRVILILYMPRLLDFLQSRERIIYIILLNGLIIGSFISYANVPSRFYSLIF